MGPFLLVWKFSQNNSNTVQDYVSGAFSMEKLFWAFICCVVPTAVSHEVRTVWRLWKPLLAQPLLCLHHYLSLSFSCQGAVHNETLPKFISEKKYIYILVLWLKS